MSPTTCSAKLQLIDGLIMSKNFAFDTHRLNLLLVHVLYVWLVATLKGGQPASKGGGGRVTLPAPPLNETLPCI